MTKIYYATNISTIGEASDSIRIANNLRQLGYEVYAAAENKSINDKSNDPTPKDIYDGDVSEIIRSNIFVVNLTGGHQDGTISEIGLVAGWNEAHDYSEETKELFSIESSKVDIPIIAFTTNTRLLQPQHYWNVPSASANHLVLGMIERHGTFVGDERNLYEYLSKENNNELTIQTTI